MEVTRALRYNKGKSAHRWWIIWRRALEGVARVGQRGAEKYEAWNYLKGAPATESVDSALRHLLAWFEGEDMDPESGEHHLNHFAWNALRLADEMQGPMADELDDRPHKLPAKKFDDEQKL